METLGLGCIPWIFYLMSDSYVNSKTLKVITLIYRPVVTIVAIVGIVLMLFKERYSFSILNRINMYDWLFITLLCMTNMLLFGLRVKYVIEKSGGTVISPIWWQKIFVNSYALNAVMPQSGAVYRAYELKKNNKLHYLDYGRAYYFIAWFGMLLILLLSSILMFVLSLDPLIKGWNVLHISLGASVLLLIMPFILFRVAPYCFPDSFRFVVVTNALRDTFTFTVQCFRDIGFTVRFLFLSLFTFLIDLIILTRCIKVLSFNISFEYTVLIYLLSTVFVAIRVTPGNIGVQELVYGIIGVQAGISVGDGLMLSIFIRVLRLLAVITLLAGLNCIGMAMSNKPAS